MNQTISVQICFVRPKLVRVEAGSSLVNKRIGWSRVLTKLGRIGTGLSVLTCLKPSINWFG
ncbi:hypothetical protein Hdeb2414_s0026g00677601 [Helianthus debilis subsp. tardiflorus]